MVSIRKIEGIGQVYADKLKQAGITTVEALLEKAASAKGREALAEQIGVSAKQILEWANRADLMRIKGIGEEFSDLLEAAGVDTVVELARRNADNLYEKLQQVNAEKKLVRRLPTRDQVKDWIEQAKNLPRVLTH